MKLGKLPARPEAVKFKLSQFVDTNALPKPPKSFGHEAFVDHDGWGVLGNDNAGDCVFAGAAHETMLWCKEAGVDTAFDDKAVLSDYSAVTGYVPGDDATDQGTDMQVAASYRRKTGIADATGKRHTIAAYLAITPGDIKQLYAAMYLFGAVGIGIRFPGSAMDQFNRRKPWSIVKGARVTGGHYVPLVAKRGSLTCVTWGQTQKMTVPFYKEFCDEALAYVSLEALTDGRSPEGFDAEALTKALNGLKAA